MIKERILISAENEFEISNLVDFSVFVGECCGVEVFLFSEKKRLEVTKMWARF